MNDLTSGRKAMKMLGDMSVEQVGRRWDKTVALFESDGWGNAGVGLVQRATKLFIPGDVVIVSFTNGGGQRQPAWCYTRKSRPVRRFFVEYCNYENDFGDMYDRHTRAPHHLSRDREKNGPTQLSDRSTVVLIEPPHGGSDGVWPSLVDAAVRQFVVESARARHAA